MKKNFLYICTLMLMSSTLAQEKEPASFRREVPHVITLFMKPYEELEALPEFQTPDVKEHLFQDPFYLARTYLAGNFKYETDPRGVYVIYKGYVDRVDFNHQVTFPRLTEKDEIDLIITRKLRPIAIVGNTVNKFVRDKKAPIAYYHLKRVTDPKTHFAYWEAAKQEVQHDLELSPDAMLIIAEPEEIFIPTELVVATAGPNLVLPPIYATEKLKKDHAALSFIKVNHYFAPVEKVTKIAEKRDAQMIRP